MFFVIRKPSDPHRWRPLKSYKKSLTRTNPISSLQNPSSGKNERKPIRPFQSPNAEAAVLLSGAPGLTTSLDG